MSRGAVAGVFRGSLAALIACACAQAGIDEPVDGGDGRDGAAEDGSGVEVPDGGGGDDGGCPAGRISCFGSCVDTTSDPANCGSCGHGCGAGEVCNEGACASTCSAGLQNCAGACVDLEVDEGHCGSCDHPCAVNEECRSRTCVCVPQCAGRECGPDTCGGTCAPGCTAGYSCSAAGACACAGPECGTSCCAVGQVCYYSACCTPSCAGRECGSDSCGGTCGSGCRPGYTCTGAGTCLCDGTPCGSVCCEPGMVCYGSACCTPSCAGRECGTDGCGGTCGSGCAAGYACDASGSCVCAGTTCGALCCGPGQVCYRSACCTPSCAGRECGTDGCGGTCGSGCDAGFECSADGECVRVEWIFEAEGPGMGHTCGRAEADGWSAATADCEEGHMLYGPYATDIPAGAHAATFRMMVDNNTADDLRVVNLDVYDANRDDVLNERAVRRREFTGTWAYQDFAVSFTSASASRLEFRVYWDDVSYVRVDKVTVR